MNMNAEERARCDAHKEETKEIMIKLSRLEVWVKIAAVSAAASIAGGNVGIESIKALAGLE